MHLMYMVLNFKNPDLRVLDYPIIAIWESQSVLF